MISAVIVAAGSGVRMGAGRRKQFLPLAGRPVLAHTLAAFDRCRRVDRLILVAPESELSWCRTEIVAQAGLGKPVAMVAGGSRRQDSVYNGLQALSQEDEAITLIHDGVRPMVTASLIEACIEGALRWRACIPVVEVVDTLKKVDPQGCILETVPRGSLRMAQTPQAFSLGLIKEAHELARRNGWRATDDASLVERMGVGVHTVAGARENIKITTPEDLRLAEFLLSSNFGYSPDK